MWGGHLIRSWAETQAILAFSTGEAELAAVVKASTEALGLQSVLDDFGFRVRIEIQSDATAAIGMVRREGLGKVRHLAVADLWIQQKAKDGTIRYSKINGKHNPADLLTKGLGSAEIVKYMDRLGLQFLSGRAASAPQIQQ